MPDDKKPLHFAGADGGVGHILSPNTKNCPHCGADPSYFVVRNYSMMWQDGDVVCTKCETRVRGYDAG